MARLLRSAASLLIYACVATVIAEALLVGYLATKWRLDRDRVVQILAIAYGIDLFAIKDETEKEQERISVEQVSYEQVLETRAVKTRNLELREQAVQDGLTQLRLAQTKVSDEYKRCKQLKESFEVALRTLHEGATATGTDEVRRILETIKPKQAKDLLVQMLDDKKLDQVVVLLAGMTDAKRAKIISEFKTAEDNEKIGEVLRRIREGVPTAEIADETRKQLQRPKPTGG